MRTSTRTFCSTPSTPSPSGCAVDGEQAEAAILDLAAVLRTIQQGVELERWPLSRELELARSVLELHRARDPDKVQLDWEVDECRCEVPPLLLLPLVENAMTHGGRGRVSLAVRCGSEVELELRQSRALRRSPRGRARTGHRARASGAVLGRGRQPGAALGGRRDHRSTALAGRWRWLSYACCSPTTSTWPGPA